jgi:hydroxyacid-oxoacid transhydrogenase
VIGPCQHYYRASLGGESAFSIDPASVVFGRKALSELGEHAKALGLRRVALYTDQTVRKQPFFERAERSLRSAGVDVAVFDGVRIEPNDTSLLEAARFAERGRFDGFVSIGGGSVIDTAKAASLLATYPAELLSYVNAPVGEGRPVPGPLPPHIACPTTSGTGSECTGIAIFDLSARKAKTGIVSRRLRPTLAIVDPETTRSLPNSVVAASGFDVLCHAIESYTARPYTARNAPSPVSSRPMSQGANPWSDLGSLEALRISGRYLVRAARDPSDEEARESMMWAATLAGIAFGNSGVHVPHGMAYAVAGLVKGYRAPGYPAWCAGWTTTSTAT